MVFFNLNEIFTGVWLPETNVKYYLNDLTSGDSVETRIIADMIIKTIGGVGIFLLGMRQISDGMQAMAGNQLRRMISKVTDNRLVATGVGAALTSLIQSSSVTTVMVVGMVNAGVMNLRQAIGVILGADIGTTITAWIISFKIADYGLPLLGLSAIIYLFSRFERARFIALFAMGLGMIFFGLEIMKLGFMPLRENQDFILLLARFHPDNFSGLLKCVMIGAFVTAVIQSSSVTVAITITLAQTQVIDYETAVALVLGENIGTTITAYLASLGATTAARRAAFAHITIKIMAVLLMLPMFRGYVSLLNDLLPAIMPIASRIAFAHSAFYILLVSVFIWLVNPLAKLLYILVPEEHGSGYQFSFFDTRLLDTPAVAFKQTQAGFDRLKGNVQQMLEMLSQSLVKSKDSIDRKLLQEEQNIDLLQKELVEYISALLSRNLSADERQILQREISLADEYESISDHVAIIIKLRNKIDKGGFKLTEQDKTHLLDLQANVKSYLEEINTMAKNGDMDVLKNAYRQSKLINQKIRKYRKAHLDRLGGKYGSPGLSLSYADILSSYRRIKEHTLNVAEIITVGR